MEYRGEARELMKLIRSGILRDGMTATVVSVLRERDLWTGRVIPGGSVRVAELTGEVWFSDNRGAKGAEAYVTATTYRSFADGGNEYRHRKLGTV